VNNGVKVKKSRRISNYYMKPESKLAWVVSLAATLVIATVVASVLLLVHVAGKQGIRAEVNFNASESMGIILNVPMYVVGPQSLIQRLVGVGVPQSLIKPVVCTA